MFFWMCVWLKQKKFAEKLNGTALERVVEYAYSDTISKFALWDTKNQPLMCELAQMLGIKWDLCNKI